MKLPLLLGQQHLADHSRKFAPKQFTRSQLFACLIFKGHMVCSYRKYEELLILMPAARDGIGLEEVPRFTTLQAFADRPEMMTLVDGVVASIGRGGVYQVAHS